MKTHSLILVLWLFVIMGFSQTAKDSLLKIYQRGEANAETLNLLAAEHFASHIDSGKMFAELALKYARVSENNHHIGEAFYQLGDAAYYSGDADSCLFFYSKSLEYYLKTELNNEIAGVYNDMGQVLQVMSFHDSATLYFDLALDYLDRNVLPQAYYSILTNKGTSYYAMGSYALANEIYLKVIEEGADIMTHESLSAVYSNLGLSYKKTSNYEAALKYYEKAFQIDDSLNMKFDKAIDLANIGGVYFSWKQYDEAQHYLNQSLDIYQELDNKRGIASIYSNIAGAQKANNQLDEARINYEKALELALEIDDNYQLASAYHGLGMLVFEEEQYEKSIEYETQAKEYFKITQRPFGLCNVSLSLCRSYLALNDFTNAKEELQLADQYAQKTNSLELKKDVALQFANFYSRKGENKKSNEYYKSYIRLNDSLFNQKSHRLVTEFNIKLKTLEQQREMEKISLENEINESRIYNKNRLIILLIIGIVIALIGILVIFRFYRQKQRTYQILYEKSKEEFKAAPKIESCQKDMIKAGIGDDVLKDLLEKLHTKMEEEKVFLNMDLSIHKLAQLMDTNTSYLSKIINDYYHQNFNSFINKYRIRAAQEMMHEKKFRNYTIEALAHECGFRSKSSFNEAFKKISGLTPGYYMQMLLKEES